MDFTRGDDSGRSGSAPHNPGGPRGPNRASADHYLAHTHSKLFTFSHGQVAKVARGGQKINNNQGKAAPIDEACFPATFFASSLLFTQLSTTNFPRQSEDLTSFFLFYRILNSTHCIDYILLFSLFRFPVNPTGKHPSHLCWRFWILRQPPAPILTNRGTHHTALRNPDFPSSAPHSHSSLSVYKF